MIDYDKLNDILHNEITNPSNQIFFDNLDEIVKLTKIMIENDDEIIKHIPKYYTHVDINDSIECVIEFLNSIKPEYVDQFQNILRERLVDSKNREEEYSVKFCYNAGETDGHVNHEGETVIEFNETIGDIFMISHEIIHKFSQPKLKYKGHVLGKESIIKTFLGESSTITIEFLLQDYLEKKYGENEEFKIAKQERLLHSLHNCWDCQFEAILLHLYKENGNYIDENILRIYLENLPKESKEHAVLSKQGIPYIKHILEEKALNFVRSLRYVIGTLLASSLHKEIKGNPDNIEKLVYLINIFGHSNHEENYDLKILYKLGIPMIGEKGVDVTDEFYKQLEEAYLEEVADSKIQNSHKKL